MCAKTHYYYNYMNQHREVKTSYSNTYQSIKVKQQFNIYQEHPSHHHIDIICGNNNVPEI